MDRKRSSRRRGSRLEDLIAARYKRAGYKVTKHKIIHPGGKRKEIDVYAKRKGERIAIESKAGNQTITSRMIEEIHKKARFMKAKAVLVASPKSKITEPTKKKSKEKGVKIKRFRFKR